MRTEKATVSADAAEPAVEVIAAEAEDEACLSLEACAARTVGLEMPEEGEFDEEDTRKIERFKMMAKSLVSSHVTLIDECQEDEALLESIRSCPATIDAKEAQIKGDDKLNHILVFYDQQEKQ